MNDIFRKEIQEWIDFIKNEDLPNISKEIYEAKKQRESDKQWGCTDMGYLNSMRDAWLETKKQLNTLERVLEIYDNSAETVIKEEKE